MTQMTLNILNTEEMLTRTQQSRSSLLSLMALVREQRVLPGRKTVVLFTRGIQVPEQMIEMFRNTIGAANRAGVSLYAVDARGLTLDLQNKSGTDILQDAILSSRRQQTLDGAAVTPNQVKVFDTAMNSIHANTQRVLQDLAESTGGFLIANTNNFRSPFRKIREDIQTYYEVSYVPSIAEYDGSFRKLTFKVRRPKVKIQGRSGYFAVPPEAGSVLAYEVPLLHALDAKPLPRAFSHRAAALRFGSAEGEIQYSVVIEVPLGGAGVCHGRCQGSVRHATGDVGVGEGRQRQDCRALQPRLRPFR